MDRETREFLLSRNSAENSKINPHHILRIAQTQNEEELFELMEEIGYTINTNAPWGDMDGDMDFTGIEIVSVSPPLDCSSWIEERRAVAQDLVDNNITDPQVWEDKLGGWENKTR